MHKFNFMKDPISEMPKLEVFKSLPLTPTSSVKLNTFIYRNGSYLAYYAHLLTNFAQTILHQCRQRTNMPWHALTLEMPFVQSIPIAQHHLNKQHDLIGLNVYQATFRTLWIPFLCILSCFACHLMLFTPMCHFIPFG